MTDLNERLHERAELSRLREENARLTAKVKEAEKALAVLLDCPDIADNDDKDIETHDAERFARATLTKLRSTK